MSDIDKRLDEIFKPISDSWSQLADAYAEEVVLDSMSGDIPYYWEDAKQAIKQLMADEFEKILQTIYKIGNDRFYDDKDYSIDAWIDDVDTYLVKKLEEWKK